MNTESDKFQSPVSNNFWDKFNLNEGLNTVGDTIKSVWGKPQTTTVIQQTPVEKEEDNTMLYVGIGGAVVLVVLLIFMLR